MEENKKFYKKSIEKYGISAKGVHWNSSYTQYKRFEVLTKFIKVKGECRLHDFLFIEIPKF